MKQKTPADNKGNERSFSKENIELDNRKMKNYSMSLINRQMKERVNYYLYICERPILKRLDISIGCETRETVIHY